MLGPRFEEALIYATRLHARQTRKGSGIPYVSHLLAVCALTIQYGGDEDEAIAALLHDAVEDQGGEATRLEILARFGPRVTAIVDGCTDTDRQPKPPWRARKEMYIERLRTAPHEVRLVSACDKLHNARSLVKDYRMSGESLWSRFHGGRDGTLWYYRTLVDALRSDGIAQLVEELDRVVTELESLAAREQGIASGK
ncbi:MAG TPA: HD domain-containing protein [Bryobacteraceae bacterium]|nr:HD domain-containing protein [Bryobacteraceae bacterium]